MTSPFLINTSDAYDCHGIIRYMTRSGGYVMVRRPRCVPFVMTEKSWRRLPKNQEAGQCFSVIDGQVTETSPNYKRKETK